MTPAARDPAGESGGGSGGWADEAQVNVRGGDGGAGCTSFLREAHRAKGGPDGGDGGNGGDVVLVADPNVATLLRFTHEIHLRAPSGTHGSGKNRHGRSASVLRVSVPPGTTVRSLDGGLLADLVNPGDAAVVARGGRGGRGNARFLTNARRAPSFAEQGEKGEEQWIRLELRLLADVALVGFPNAGKSTFVASVSAARPKIAAYPFTTLRPHLGVVRAGDHEFVVADVPGLIEGAAEGRGLGHRFLRHVERSRVLLMLLDPLNFEADVDRQEDILLTELRDYQPELLDRPRVTAITKADAVPDVPDMRGYRRRRPDAFCISAATHEGLEPLLRELGRLVDATRATAPATVGFVVHRPQPSGFTIGRLDDASFVVTGPDALRAVALSDLTDRQALAYVHGRLRGLGVLHALEEAGCSEGAIVHIGAFEFEYVPDDAETGTRS